MTTPARSYADRRQPGDSLVTVTAWLAGGMQRLDIYAPLAPAEGAGPHPAPLSALLSRSLTSGARIEVSTVSGNCAESHG